MDGRVRIRVESDVFVMDVVQVQQLDRALFADQLLVIRYLYRSTVHGTDRCQLHVTAKAEGISQFEDIAAIVGLLFNVTEHHVLVKERE